MADPTVRPWTTPTDVARPHVRPPRSVLRVVSAVSGPGTMMTTAAMPMKVSSAPIAHAGRRSVATVPA